MMTEDVCVGRLRAFGRLEGCIALRQLYGGSCSRGKKRRRSAFPSHGKRTGAFAALGATRPTAGQRPNAPPSSSTWNTPCDRAADPRRNRTTDDEEKGQRKELRPVCFSLPPRRPGIAAQILAKLRQPGIDEVRVATSASLRPAWHALRKSPVERANGEGSRIGVEPTATRKTHGDGKVESPIFGPFFAPPLFRPVPGAHGKFCEMKRINRCLQFDLW